MRPAKPKLELFPVTLAEANALVAQWHRHHRPVVGHRFSIGVAIGAKCVGIAIVGRPVARRLDDGFTAEVTRVATDGTPNACSKLLGAAWRAWRAMGGRKIVTYTLPEEGGASLRGAGWHCIGKAGGGSWNCKSRPRIDKHPLQVKFRWEMTG